MDEIKLYGYIDENHRLIVKDKIPLEPQDVKVIVSPIDTEEKRRKFQRMKKFQGSLKGSGIDGMEYQREMRKEWDDRSSIADERLK